MKRRLLNLFFRKVNTLLERYYCMLVIVILVKTMLLGENGY